MSVVAWFSVCCDDCGTVCGGVEEMQDGAKEARRTARSLGWVHRPDPDTGKRVDLCVQCAAKPKYHQQSTMNVAAQLGLFDAQIARHTGPEAAYWTYLRQLFIDALPTRPQPFSHYAPMFDEEFS